MDATIVTQQIPRQHWPELFSDLTQQYRGWRISVEVLRLDIGDQWMLEGLPLLRMHASTRGPHAGNIILEAGDPSSEVVLHHVLQPVKVLVAMTEAGGEADIEVISEDGTVTLARLRPAPALPQGSSAWRPESRLRDRGVSQEAHGSEDFGEPTPVQAGAGPFRRVSGMAGSFGGGARLASAWGASAAPDLAGAARPAESRGSGSSWPYVLRGVAAIGFGVLALLMPGLALLSLVVLFGVYATTDGVFNLVAAFTGSDAGPQQPRWLLVLKAAISIAAGALALLIPGITAIALLYVIAGWAVATGIMEIVAAFRLRHQLKGEWLLALGGVLSIAVGVLLAMFPGPGALGLVLWIAAYAIVLGVIEISQGLTLGDRLRRGEQRGTAAAKAGAVPVYGANRA